MMIIMMMMVMLYLTMRGQCGYRNGLQYLPNVYSNIFLNILVYLYGYTAQFLFHKQNKSHFPFTIPKNS